MAVLERLVRTARSWRRIAPPKTLTPSRAPLRDLPPPLYRRSSQGSNCNIGSDVKKLRLVAAASGSYSILPAVLAGLLGAGVIETAYSDADEVASKPPLPSEPPANHVNLEETAKKERQRIEELLKDKGMKNGSYPRFTVAVKGQKVIIKFQIHPTCEVAQLIANLVSNLGLKVEEHGGGSDVLLRAWDSSVAWQLTLNPFENLKESGVNEGHSVDRNRDGGDLCILIFRSLEIEFIKQGSLNTKELDALISALQLAGGRFARSSTLVTKPRESSPQMGAQKSIDSLKAMGVRIYGLDAPRQNNSYSEISWDNIAGYDQQKREIEDTILLALNSPQVYDDIARGTRRKFESNRPRAVLFEGPPGTGKTSCARVIANQAGVPLLYVPLEIVLSKYYGESERLLGQVFSLANQLPDGSIIFLDEVDAFATARDGEIHEATRRILSVLLRQIDGFEQDKKVVVIAATNRKQDLDPALISRFDSMIGFGLPDEQNRREIAAQYAKHLTESELVELARVTDEMSGRDIRDACQQAERSWASKLIRGQATNNEEQQSLPPLEEYIKSAINRRKALLSVAEQRNQNPNQRMKKPHLDLLSTQSTKSIRKSECPKELEPADRRSSVHVNLIKRDEKCPEPEKKRQVAFQGVGRTLGSSSTSAAPETTISSTPLNTAPNPSPGLVVVDESLPSTSIQLRLADGTRMIAHFNFHHTVDSVRSFINASRPGSAANYQLQIMGFPPKLLTDPTQTIEQAGLANSVVIQKF
ncbi:uncharacterized protein LOC111278295 isoform X2 [Durio zibethinus]|uniref:Uncharacterized protein LOC111278295 isoform X2 n=1 Tax=Durio zibethinus TaxID=66656 RepID=A0A6P5WXR1_DURZI|nr:uncharacterized protein LOC111278295 isoform X2 [Durio zibethinus]